MKYKRRVRWLVVLIALFLIVPTYLGVTVQRAHATGPYTYFIDSHDGNDDKSVCNGLSDPQPPQPGICPWKSFANINTMTLQSGDKIWLEQGDSWSPTPVGEVLLHPLGSGTSGQGNSITITSYRGDQGANAPVLNGQGDPAVVELSNQHDWTIENLEITNWPTYSDCQTEPPAGLNAHCYGYRSGVYIHGQDYPLTYGVLNGIKLENLNVHHVLGEYGKTKPFGTDPELDPNEQTGGILFEITKGSSPTPTTWANVTIYNNIVNDVWRNGIHFHSDWSGNADTTQHCVQFTDPTGMTAYQPSTGINVNLNQVSNVGGNSISVGVSLQPILQNNVAWNGDLDKASSAGIWTYDSHAATIEHNKVYSQDFYPNAGNASNPYDSDLCDFGAIIEYNFAFGGFDSTGNNGTSDGGFLLFEPQSSNTIVRYNVSQNDGTFYRWTLEDESNTKGGITYYGGCGATIYNNSFFVDQAPSNPAGVISSTKLVKDSNWCSGSLSVADYFQNNVVENLSQSSLKCTMPPNWTESNNVFFDNGKGPGCQNPPPSGDVYGDPKFQYPGQAGYGSGCGSGCYLPEIAYTLQDNTSKAYCEGTAIADNGGYDYIGNPLPSSGIVNAGALQQIISGPNSC